VIRPGEVQRMSAGTGIVHSEFNPSPTEPVHFLQIWILPERSGLKPSYEQKAFPAAERRGRLRLAASPGGEEGAITLHQDARLFLGSLAAGESVRYAPAAGRGLWLQIAGGIAALNETELREGDGAAIEGEAITVAAETDCELLLFDLA